ncbi:MAG: T9SS type A sorting domain-containing protein [Flavobacteriales bacterium]|nr:T9SS type A sorting domain-containing protein [Flavobacteriales bacterium]
MFKTPILNVGSLLAGLLLSPFTSSTAAQSGSLDGAFNVGTGANGRVYTMVAQPDGKQIVGGAFTTYNGTARNRVVRVSRSGALDATFVIGTGPNGQVNHAAVDANGKILLGGSFTSYNGTNRSRLVRVNSNGTLDGSFNIGTGFNGNVNFILVQPDGKILVAGMFTTYNGATQNRIVRLNSDGTLDATYQVGTGVNGDVYAASLDAEGRLIIGGSFTAVNGTTRINVARLTTTGAVDTGFDPGAGPNNAVYCIAVQRDGRILLGGLFTSYNAITPSARIARLERSGAYDNTFSVGTGFNSWVYTIAVQGDGKILAGGDFTTYNGTARNRMVRLNTNGSVDSGFSMGSAFNNWVYAITWQPEGRTTVAGGFTSYNGAARNRILRLQTGCDENVQLTVKADAFGSQTSWELMGEGFTYPVCNGSGFTNNTEVTVSCCVPHGPMRLRVLDSAGDGMTTGGYVLKDASGKRIIDNANDGAFASESSIATGGSFYLPMSAYRPLNSICDKVDWTYNQLMVASATDEVSAQWGVGDQTDDGYEFWFYDPDGSYSQRKFRSHAAPGSYGSGATRACYLNITWTPNPIPENVLLNVKVRGRVNGTNREWGAACRFKLDPVSAACPRTKLIDTPGDQYFSCGASRTRSQYVTAKPVSGANRYEFEFVNVGDGYNYTIQSTNYHRYLNWASPALVSGRTYQVRVRASRDNGASWCQWGETCSVSITGPNAMAAGADVDRVDELQPFEMVLWPNPSAGDGMQISLTGHESDASVDITIMDMTGKLVHQQRIKGEGPALRSWIGFDGDLPAGQYFLRASVDEHVALQRFVVTR